MSVTFRAMLVTGNPANCALLTRLTNGSNIVIDAIVAPDLVIASVAERIPDLMVVDAEIDTDVDPGALTRICSVLKANPATVHLPLIAIAKSAKGRRAAFEGGVDECFTQQVRKDEFLVRANALLRASAARRQSTAEQLAEEVRKGENVRAAFRRYISPNLADQILANPQLSNAVFAGARTRANAAVMFADMRGFTGISERLQPGEVVELLNEFFSLLTDITFEYDGTVFNMAGDSLMVGFGVPVEQADESERAIFAARAMLEKFNLLAYRWKLKHDIDTGLGIGINVGEVVAGNIGSRAYMNYTIIGDTVNVASRLGQRARAGEILFSDAVKCALDRRGVDIQAMPLPSLVLRGRINPIDIFCVPTEDRVDFRTAH